MGEIDKRFDKFWDKASKDEGGEYGVTDDFKYKVRDFINSARAQELTELKDWAEHIGYETMYQSNDKDSIMFNGISIEDLSKQIDKIVKYLI